MKQDNFFVQVPDWITNSGISDGAYRLYAVLGTYASRDRRTCHPARSTLAERTGKTVRSVTRYLQELEDLGAIRVTHRKSEESPKEWTSNEYMLITTPPASVSPPSDTDVTTPSDTDVPGVVTQMSHKPEPMNQNHLNQRESPPGGGTLSRGQRLPEGWHPAPETIAQMRQEKPGVDLQAEHRKFTDYWKAAAGAKGRKADWEATWRNWIRNARPDPRSAEYKPGWQKRLEHAATEHQRYQAPPPGDPFAIER